MPAVGSGPVVVTAAVPVEACEALRAQVERTDPATAGGDVYAEALPDGASRVCRIERFTELLPAAHGLLDTAARLAREAVGDEAVLMKDKINLKWPGGGGYRCHQDSRAYPPTMGTVVTVGVALTPADEQRGGLWVAAGVDRLLDSDEQGCVTAAERERLSFSCPALQPGDALVFDGHVPHYSGDNLSAGPRMLALLTFAPPDGRGAGEVRDDYYAWRDAEIVAGGAPRLSTIDDFAGTLVTDGGR